MDRVLAAAVERLAVRIAQIERIDCILRLVSPEPELRDDRALEI
jgi:hypothetical protein